MSSQEGARLGPRLLSRRRAVRAIGERTDRVSSQGDASSDLTEVLGLDGKPGEAVSALEQVLERYQPLTPTLV
jgi:hypothetical protein